MPNPSIVLASLDDEKLRQSITNLVAHVKRATHTMLTDTNSTVDAMEKKLKSLGNIKIGSGGSVDGGVSKHTKAQNADTEAIEKNIAAQDRQIKKNKEVAMTFDQKAAAIQKASRMPSEMRPEKPETRARDSYYAFVAGLKEQRDSLAKVINDFERGLNNAISKRTNEINNQISASKIKIQELNQELNRANATRNAARASQVQGQLDKELRHYKDLESQLKNVNNEFGTSKISLAAMNVEHHRVANLMREETQVQQQQAQTTQQQITEEQRRTEEIRKQAAAIRATKEWQEKGFASVNGKVFYDSERVKGTKQHIREIGTLEEQILRSMQQQSIAERANTQEAQQRLDTIKRIAAEARAEMKQYGTSYHYTGYAVQNPFVYAENDARAKGLTIEQQIEQILKEQTREYERQAEKIQQTTQKREKSAAQGVEKSFKATLAQTLGVNADEINSTGTSIKNLTAYSKQLQQAWEKLSSAGRHSPFGKQLQEELQQTQLQLQRVRNEASKPISLNFVKGMPEKTLNDIAYKIQQLQSYKRGLNITDPKQIAELKQVDAEINQLQKDLNKYMGTTKQATEMNKTLARSWNYMKNRLAFYFTVGAGTQFIKGLIEVRSQYEMNERALGILIGSAEYGTKVFSELSQMSLISPYTLIELSAAAKQLTAYGVAARDVVDTTRRLADMASAVGVPMERLTYALGQIQAYGYLNSRDQRMFANAGIPLAAELAKYYTEIEGKLVSTGDVYDRIKKKAVGYADVMQVVYRMTDEGGQFFDFQAKMADTLKVRLANLTLAWNNMLNEIGKSEQGALTTGIGLLKDLFLKWRDVWATVKSLIYAFGVFKVLQFTVLKGLSTQAEVAAWKLDGTTKGFAKLTNAANAFKSSMLSMAANPWTWVFVGITAIISLANAYEEAKEKARAFNSSLREGGAENVKNINSYLESMESLRKKLEQVQLDETNSPKKTSTGAIATVKTNIDESEAKKAWEAMREQIELASSSSSVYIQRLLQIENVSERLREGFAILENIKAVNQALSEVSDNTFKVEQSFSGWWNLWTLQDGLIQNLKDYNDALEGTSSVMSNVGKDAARLLALGAPIGSIANASIAINERAISQWKELKSNIESTTESLKNFIAQRNWSSDPEKIQELYGQFTQKLALENQLDPKTAYYLQLLLEEGRTKATKEALVARMNDEYEAWKIETDEVAKMQLAASYHRHVEELNTFNQTTAKERVEWSEFTKYMANNHKSEIASMFRGMNEEQIKSLNFQEGEYKKWVDRMVKDYAKAHKMSYDEAFGYLKHWVQNANMWSIFIKLTISTEDGKSAFDALKELDQQVDDADAQIKRLERRQKELLAIKKRTFKEEKELGKVTTELEQARKDKQKAESEGGHGKQEDKDSKKAAADAKKRAREAAKAQREAETELQKTLKNELSLIDKLRSSYKALTDEGVSQGRALEIVTSGFGETVKAINDVLVDKWGLAEFDPNKFAGISNPRELVKLLEDQLNALVKTGRAKPIEIQDLQAKVKDLKVDAAKFDTKIIAEGLNNELGKLKDEYELALEFDANPVMGDAFLSALGFDEEGADEFLNSLPHTFEKYAERVQKSISNAITKESESTGAKLSMFSITGGQTVEEWAKENDILETSNLFKEIKQGFDGFKNTLQKNLSDAFKSVDSYVEKYGSLQDKLLLIDKETDSQRRKINDAFYTEELRKTKEYQAAVSATESGAKEKTSKAYWEDFKSSDLYAMTFEDVKNTSTRAIDMILGKLAELKDKVKESPESMKALTKAMEDLEKEKLNRDPFNGVSQSLKDMAAAAREAAAAKKELAEADEAVADAQEEVEVGMDVLNMFDGNTHEQTAAQEKLTRAKQRQAEAQKKLTAAENKGKKAQEQLKASLQGISGQLDSVKGLFDVVAELFRAGGDDETADAIKGINEGFTIMTQVISAVGIALTILESENPWLLAAAAALSVIVGLVSFLSGNSNKKITEKVEESERAVKRLENTYKDLEYSIEQAYGTAEYGARRAAIANRQLQLVELQRQLRLEESRDSKNRDEDRILELKGQIIDLRNEIKQSVDEITNDLLGISSIGDAAEQLVSSMIEAFKQGEDYMKQYDESFEKMIDNMIMKAIVSRVIGDRIEQMWNQIKAVSEQRGEADRKRIEELTKQLTEAQDKQMSTQAEYDNLINDNTIFSKGIATLLKKEVDSANSELERIKSELAQAEKDYAKAVEPTKEDIDSVRNMADGWRESVKNEFEYWMSAFGIKYGEGADNQLSNLQQGIQGITEDTAGALEAYMNIVSQRVFYNGSLLEQIRDAVVGMDMDVQMATQAQMLLQLQQSYQVQMSIQGILQGVLTPSGRAFSVELLS